MQQGYWVIAARRGRAQGSSVLTPSDHHDSGVKTSLQASANLVDELACVFAIIREHVCECFSGDRRQRHEGAARAGKGEIKKGDKM